MELGGDFKVIVLRPRAAAQCLEIEPHHAAGLAASTNFTRFDVQHRIFVAHLGQLIERLGHLRIGLWAKRRVVQLDVLQRAAPVVRAVVHVHHFQLFVEQCNRGQNAIAVQPIGVQLVRLEVRSRHETHTVVEQRRQQAVQDHGVSDVGDVELIKADELVALGNACAKHVQRVHRALQ